MIKNLGLQLYTIRDHMKDEASIDASFARLAEIGYTEAQTAGCTVAPEIFAELAKKHGINIVGTHYDWDAILNDYDETIRVHKLWNTTNIGIGGMPGDARKSYDALMKFIEDFNRAASVYAKEGFKLTYHNHSFEFVKIHEGKTIMDLLVENLDEANTSFVLDTCWVAHGGGDVRYWLEKLAGRVDILHLKDLVVYYNADGKLTHTMTEIGAGNLWWDGIIETAEKTGVKYYTVEQDSYFANGDPFDSVKQSRDFLAKYM
ncbi:MAG: sugar phosphate isomerase/epimerase [Ruminococcaceae bacterium]|nr:sugar phosphate isomerase/epimerase [Oscillospiraceae bacterium]